ncbi:hypothetical protein NECAME_04874 [Necator americanus]|uniref:Uncharacterized protein n=1 Tax=Necator americanus TaxID=51031 RepID=W2SLP2_NECAM|nr:hypothetical protein NECAME_04874 [Necator americanus]ETN70594.1 hypothetical protein NECAME_04874 [Necator americanus]
MLGVVSRWLAERHVFFSDQYMETNAREKMIQKNIRHVILVSGKEERSVHLYDSGVASKRFILILEGKATVFFPKASLQFEWIVLAEILSIKLCLRTTCRLKLDHGRVLEKFYSRGFLRVFAAVKIPNQTSISLRISLYRLNNRVDFCRYDFNKKKVLSDLWHMIPIMSVVHALRISRFVKQLRAPKASTSDEDDPVPVLLGGRGRGKNKLSHNFSVIVRSPTVHDGRVRSVSMVAATIHEPPSDDATSQSK